MVPVDVLIQSLGSRLAHIPDGKDEKDYTGHGTGVAAIAGGTNFGVASKANLHLIKMSQRVRRFKVNPKPNEDKVEDVPAYSSYQTVAWSIRAVFEHWDSLEERKPPNGAVVNLSIGVYAPPPSEHDLNPEMDFMLDVFLRFVVDAKLDGISFVFAAGNVVEGDASSMGYLDEYFPCALGTPSSDYLTVGGVNDDGTLWPETRYKSKGTSDQSPRPDIWAQASRITIANRGGGAPIPDQKGTSFAAPAVVSTFPWLEDLILTSNRRD